MTARKIRISALLGCSHCGMFSGWVSKRFDPDVKKAPESINTVCSVCFGRLRHKRGMRDSQRKYTHIYTAGRGAHNRSTSVFKYIPWNDPSTCKSEAAKMNRQILENRSRRKKSTSSRSFKKASEF